MSRGTCPECDGEGYVEIDVPRAHNFNRDVGYIDTRMETCETCHGDGEVGMKTYEVICEGVVQRTVIVEAVNSAAASMAAKGEFASLVGADKDAVAIIDMDRIKDDG